MIQFIKNWTLPIAMLVGAAGYRFIGALSFLSPILIFIMLLLTFSKVSIKELRLQWSHLWLLLIEILGAVLLFWAVRPIDYVAAQGIMVCMICPTATAAAVVTGKLQGNVASITTYTLLCNLTVGVAVPILFPLLAPSGDSTSFLAAFWIIMRKLFPLLICPFLVAQLLRAYLPKVNAKLSSVSGLAFYLWAVALTIAMGITVKSLVETSADRFTELLLAIGALVACALQFAFGKWIGSKYGDTVAAGQSLGQKNTILAIWMCDTYLNPLSALAPGIYVVYQNIFNSWQLYKNRKKAAENG